MINHTTGIGLREFLKIAKKEEEISEKELLHLFQTFDSNKNGFISTKEFKALLSTVKKLQLNQF